MVVDKFTASRAKAFTDKWSQYDGSEMSSSHKYLFDLLQNVFGVDVLSLDFIQFEKPVVIGGATKRIDAYIPSSRTLIEMKAPSASLNDAVYRQAKSYDDALKFSEKSRWIVTCNFKTIHIYDMEYPGSEPTTISLKNLVDSISDLSVIVDDFISVESISEPEVIPLEDPAPAVDVVPKAPSKFRTRKASREIIGTDYSADYAFTSHSDDYGNVYILKQ